MNRIYVQTNDAERNEVIAFDRSDDGRLQQLGRYETGGRGTGTPHLASQSSLALSDDGAWLLVTNAGSDELSLFAVEADGLRLAKSVPSGGSAPTSVAVRGDLVYALNNGGASNISGFRLDDRGLTPVEGSARALSAEGADPAQVSFSHDGRTLVVSERGTNSDQRLRGRRARLRRRPSDDPVLRRHALRVRLRRRRRDRDRGLRRRGRQGGSVLVRARRVGPARTGQRLGGRHAQRGLLGRGDEGRPVRVRDELRRRDGLELRGRRRRQPRAARAGGRLDAIRRGGRPRRGDHPRRALPVRDRRRRPACVRLDDRRTTEA